MKPLTPADRRALRARAHALGPIVTIGAAGLTAAVLQEIDRALGHHELIKIRVLGEGCDRRVAALGRICEALDAAPVQIIGKILLIFRPKPETPPVRSPERSRARDAVRGARRGKRRDSGG